MDGFQEWYESRVKGGHIAAGANPGDYIQAFYKVKVDEIENEWKDKVVEAKRSRRRSLSELEERRDCRDILRALGKSVNVIDGNDKGILRVWLDEVARAGEVSGAAFAEIIRFAMANSRGDLQKVIHDIWKDATVQTWEGVMVRIGQTLLTADEEAYLRETVTNMFQLKGESEPSYSRRYWDAVYKAWPRTQMNEQIRNMLISQFADSLREVQTRWHVKVNSPDTIEEAIRLANSSGRALASRRHREEEDMEIGAIRMHKTDKEREQEASTVRTLQGEVKSLARKLQRCEDVAAAREEGIRRDFREARGYEHRGRRDQMGPDTRQSERRSVECFLCGGPHRMRDCPLTADFVQWRKHRGAAPGAPQGAVQSGN